jgi:hypothetical protein
MVFRKLMLSSRVDQSSYFKPVYVAPVETFPHKEFIMHSGYLNHEGITNRDDFVVLP